MKKVAYATAFICGKDSIEKNGVIIMTMLMTFLVILFVNVVA